MAKKRSKPVVEVPPLRLEYRSPAELAENPRNWRTHPQEQVDALTGALSEVGWAGACLYNEATGRLIDGHLRKKTAHEQGCEKVPVLIGSWTEEQELIILATLDPIGAMATTNAEALALLLQKAEAADEALQKLMDDMAAANAVAPPLPAPGGGGDDFDATPTDGPTRVQKGDLYVIGGYVARCPKCNHLNPVERE